MIARRISYILREDYLPHGINEIARKTSINWETTKTMLDTFEAVEVVRLEGKKYVWNVIPSKVFASIIEKYRLQYSNSEKRDNHE